mmetsp:Transcript_1763/g.6944  ORF Transcript_1763/g.6944 Transcript_1763/m.6944 type:complete len:238 (-) Transcript_1763:38-751(-)
MKKGLVCSEHRHSSVQHNPPSEPWPLCPRAARQLEHPCKAGGMRPGRLGKLLGGIRGTASLNLAELATEVHGVCALCDRQQYRASAQILHLDHVQVRTPCSVSGWNVAAPSQDLGTICKSQLVRELLQPGRAQGDFPQACSCEGSSSEVDAHEGPHGGQKKVAPRIVRSHSCGLSRLPGTLGDIRMHKNTTSNRFGTGLTHGAPEATSKRARPAGGRRQPMLLLLLLLLLLLPSPGA